MHKAVVFFLFAMLLAVGSLFAYPLNVHAQTETPPPLPYCPATVTPTSVIPTFVFPTFVFPTSVYTSTPCPPGGYCPTATPYSTVTVIPTATYTPTVTSTPSFVGSIQSCYWSSLPNVVLESSAAGCTISVDKQSASAWIDKTTLPPSNFNESKLNVTWVGVDLLHITYNLSASSSSSTGKNTFIQQKINAAPSWTLLTGCNGCAFSNYLYTDYQVSKGVNVTGRYELLGQAYQSGSVYGSATIFLTPSLMTPSPTVTPGLTPGVNCQPGNPNEGSVDGGGTKFSPPVIVAGSCFTIVPNLEMEVPSIVDWTVSSVPSTIGIPGIEICTQYWSMNLMIFGFNILNSISVVVGFVCVAIIYRTFQN